MFHRSKVASFQEQDCKLTLRKALEEFYNINSSFFNKPNPNNDWNELLVHHDVGHVFFGVNTTLIDEAAGDCWTLFATDMKFSEYLKYTKTPEAQRILKSIGIKKLFKSIIYTIPLLIKVFISSKKMTRKWEVRGYEKYLDTPLFEVRKMYNLQILTY